MLCTEIKKEDQKSVDYSLYNPTFNDGMDDNDKQAELIEIQHFSLFWRELV